MKDSAELLEIGQPFESQSARRNHVDYKRIANIAHRLPVIENMGEYIRELDWCVPSERTPVGVEGRGPSIIPYSLTMRFWGPYSY